MIEIDFGPLPRLVDSIAGPCSRCGGPLLVVARGDEASIHVRDDDAAVTVTHTCPVACTEIEVTIGYADDPNPPI